MEENFDVEKEAESDSKLPGSLEEVEKLAILAHSQIAIEDKIEKFEEEVKRLKHELWKVSSELIPNHMLQMGIAAVVLDSGDSLSVADHYFGSISQRDPESAEEAISWLVENGFADLVKHEIILGFTKGNTKKVNELLEKLRKLGFDPKDRETVHPQTLKAWVKEQMQAGKVFPLETFKAGVERRSTIKRAG